jgi:hypothetical protein
MLGTGALALGGAVAAPFSDLLLNLALGHGDDLAHEVLELGHCGRLQVGRGVSSSQLHSCQIFHSSARACTYTVDFTQ